VKLHLGCGPVIVPGWVNVDKSPNVLLSRVPALKRGMARIGVLTQGHVDASFTRDVVHADVLAGLPYPDGSAERIYHAHVIEHLSRPQALRFLQECARLLAPGGVMRVTTPDLRQIVAAYEAGERGGPDAPMPADRFMQMLETYVDLPGARLQRVVRRNFATAYVHQWLYDAESLAQLMREAGLEPGPPLGFREGGFPDLDQLEIREQGLFMEATRPGA
jgi:predicted SAM-dependent methyltransferase